MTHRTPTVGGNWKMNTDRASAADLARALGDALAGLDGVEVAVFPPFPYLLTVAQVLAERRSPIVLGAQDVSDRANGAFTGEVSAAMLADCGARAVLCGHSERRHVIGEGDALINAKAKAALAGGLGVVLCVGETLDQRKAGRTDSVNEAQTRAGLAGIAVADLPRVTIAYEPVWAIGTGMTATPADAQAAHARIRAVVGDLCGQAAAQAMRIQYGGSVKPDNAAELFAQPDIDGGLIGGASLKVGDFAPIVRAAVG